MTSRDLCSDYEELLFVRCLDEKISALSKQGRARLYTPFRGQEAAQVALAKSIRADDWLLPTFRDSAAIYKHGVPLEALLSFWMGYEEGHLNFASTWPVCAPVATQLPHAVGLAMSEKRAKRDRLVAVCLGDGAMSKGDCHEALNLASLWSLPVLFFCQNNRWAISTPIERQSANEDLLQRAQSYRIWGERVDGDDLYATEAACARAVAHIRSGQGPAFIEAQTWRQGGHSVIDQPEQYRSRSNHKAPAEGPLRRFEKKLEASGIEVVALRDHLSKEFERQINESVKRAESSGAKHRAAARANFETTYAEIPPELQEQADRALAVSPRRARGPRPTILLNHKRRRGEVGEELNLSEAINLALHEAFEADPRVLTLGQDIATLGGVFRVTRGLSDRFGEARVIDTPISESGVMGACIGLAAGGALPVCEVQFAGFIYSAYEQLRSHAGRIRQRTRGSLSAPLVVRTPVGGGVSAPESHSESIEALFAHTPGIKVVAPSGPRIARALLHSAIQDPDPVIFLEPTSLYFSHREWVPQRQEKIPLGFTLRRRRGEQLTAVSFGASMHRLLTTCEALSRRCSVEVLELATISPLDITPILRSVQRTRRLCVFHEGPRNGDLGAELLARVTEAGIQLERFERITGWDIPYPYPAHEQVYLIEDEQLRERLIDLCAPPPRRSAR